MLLLAACRPERPSLPITTASPTASSALAAADRELWSGRWAEAERDYRRLLATGSSHAGSHLALLLVYENRFVEAVSQAGAAVQAEPDSDTYARLARALDWSGDIPAALAAGAQAVAARPIDPLAYDFYGEALSDAGRFTDAEALLTRAESAAGSLYERAEADREWSNYYRDRGRGTDAFDYVELAQRVEPAFPQRTLELATEYFAAGGSRAAAAKARLDSLLKEFSREPAVLSAAADAAFSAGDAADAERFYRAALAKAPGDPGASLGLAELLMATKKDAPGARAALLSARRRNPGSEPVAEYLNELDALVLNLPADAGGATPTLDSEREAAFTTVNSFRQRVGLPALKEDPALTTAAEAHAYYVLFNSGAPGLAGLGVHAEDPSLPGFTGANSAERDRRFGYAGFQSSEVLNHTFTSAAAVEVWIDSVYHRLPLLGREATAFGYGEAQVGTLAVNVMDFGVAAGETGAAIEFPYNGETAVPATFTGNEVPDPAPNARYPLGYPITLAAGGSDTLTVSSATMNPAGGAAVAVIVDKPGQHDLDPNELAVLPQSPLEPGTIYEVHVRGLLDGRPWSATWSFQVAD